ncbi:hypothetical protein DSM112329_01401 [Paraconexibacter sp. AEG42_29]|uniref:histidine kinase n=1 Tax=Paraconexibacter sp. AEG42_29 TaxID=2997339 RepID=A0AAU7ASU0_9ACTN
MEHAPAGVEPETNPEVARLLKEQREFISERMPPRELAAYLVIGIAFLVAAVAFVMVGDTDGFDVVPAIVLLVAYAAAGRVHFEIGPGHTDPSLLVLVPALFIEPPATVPLLIAAGCLLSRVPDYVTGAAHPEGALAALGNAWHAVGPAVVLAVAVDAGGPRFSDAGWYLLAFLAYVACDAASGITRDRIALGVASGLQLRILAQVYALDALLAPVGLMAALATAREQYAFLLVAPLLAALAILARERGRRLDNALELSETRAQVLEAELEATRTRMEVLGAVSHGLQTPVAGVVAIAGVLARRGAGMPAEALTEAAGRLEGDALALRQLVRQALDYVRLAEGEPLPVRLADVDVAALVREAAGRLPAGATGVAGSASAAAGSGGEVVARADAVRVHQILAALVARALAVSPDPAAIRMDAATDARDGAPAIVVTVTEGGEPLGPDAAAGLVAAPSGALGTLENQGTGVDLFVATALAEAMGGTLAVTPAAAGNSWRLTLPAAGPRTAS